MRNQFTDSISSSKNKLHLGSCDGVLEGYRDGSWEGEAVGAFEGEEDGSRAGS